MIKSLTIPRNEKVKDVKGWIYCGSSIIIVSMITIISGLISALDSPTYVVQLLLPSLGLIFPLLIIGFVSFLYGIKKVTSLRKFRQKKSFFIIFFGSLSFLISITLVIYGYGSSTWCRLFPYSLFDCVFRFSGLSKAIIYSGISLLFISTLFIIYGLYQIQKSSLKKDVVEEIGEKKDISAKTL